MNTENLVTSGRVTCKIDGVNVSLCSLLERLQNVFNMIRLKLCIILLTISRRSRTSRIILGSGRGRQVNIADWHVLPSKGSACQLQNYNIELD